MSLPVSPLDVNRPAIVVATRYFCPGYKGGGPIRSLVALCRHLGNSYAFCVVTTDRDFGDAFPYEGIRTASWVPGEGCRICYLSPGVCSGFSLLHRVREVNPHCLYVNSLFDPMFSILPLASRWVAALKQMPVILAPRGELSAGALKLKAWKKERFLSAAGRLGLFRRVIWQASTDLEKAEILEAGKRFPGLCPSPDRIMLARNLVSVQRGNGFRRIHPKEAGRLRAVFLSRVTPKKNLAEAIRLLGQVRGKVSLDVYGALDPEAYWKVCLEAHNTMAPNLQLVYHGAIPHHQAQQTFSEFDLFLLPTLGENFGHVILESLAAGCPVLLSDQTPWRGLASRKAGWDIALSDTDAWGRVLQEVTDMGENRHQVWRRGAWAEAERAMNDTTAIEAHRALFRRAMEERP